MDEMRRRLVCGTEWDLVDGRRRKNKRAGVIRYAKRKVNKRERREGKQEGLDSH